LQDQHCPRPEVRQKMLRLTLKLLLQQKKKTHISQEKASSIREHAPLTVGLQHAPHFPGRTWQVNTELQVQNSLGSNYSMNKEE